MEKYRKKIKVLADQVRTYSKELGWVFLGQFLMISGSFIGIRLLTKQLVPSAYGELSLALTLATLVNQTLYGPLGNGISRFYAPAKESESLNTYFKTVFELVTKSTIFLLIISTVSVSIWFLIYESGNTIYLALFSLIYSLILGMNSILSLIQGAARNRSIVALHQGAETWLKFVLATILLIQLSNSSIVALSGYFLSALIIFASQSFFFWKNFNLVFGKNDQNANKLKKPILEYYLSFVIMGLFAWLRLASDRWSLQLFSSSYEVGLYAVLFQLGYYPMSFLSGIFIQFLTPIFFNKVGDGLNPLRNSGIDSITRDITLLFLSFTFTLFIFTWLFHKEIFSLLVSNDYLSVSYLLPWAVLSGGLFASSNSLVISMMSKRKTFELTMITVVTALAGCIFNLLGAYLYAIEGTVFAGLLFSIFYFMLIYIIDYRKREINSLKVDSGQKEA